MRRIALAAVVVIAGSVGFSTSAVAVPVLSVQKFTLGLSPSVAGTDASPTPASMSVRAWFDDIRADLDQERQFATVNANIFLPREIRYADRFPSCSPATVFQDAKQCPKGSLVGTGTAFGKGLGLDELETVRAFNLEGGRGLTLLFTGESPLIIHEIVVGTLTGLADPLYGYKLSLPFPRNLQSPAPGVIAAMTNLQLSFPIQTVKSGGSQVPYIATTGCSASSWASKYIADYTTTYDSAIQSTQTIEIQQPCTGAAPTKTPSGLRRFTAVFATAARRGSPGSRNTGQLRGLVALTGIPSGSSVSVRCTRSCATKLRRKTRWEGTRTRVNLKLTLRRSTVIAVTITAPDGATRTQRYRFVLGTLGLLAREIR